MESQLSSCSGFQSIVSSDTLENILGGSASSSGVSPSCSLPSPVERGKYQPKRGIIREDPRTQVIIEVVMPVKAQTSPRKRELFLLSYKIVCSSCRGFKKSRLRTPVRQA